MQSKHPAACGSGVNNSGFGLFIVLSCGAYTMRGALQVSFSATHPIFVVFFLNQASAVSQFSAVAGEKAEPVLNR